jgi:hypothetical protein
MVCAGAPNPRGAFPSARDATGRLNRVETSAFLSKIAAFLHEIDAKSRISAGFFAAKKERHRYNHSARGERAQSFNQKAPCVS